MPVNSLASQLITFIFFEHNNGCPCLFLVPTTSAFLPLSGPLRCNFILKWEVENVPVIPNAEEVANEPASVLLRVTALPSLPRSVKQNAPCTLDDCGRSPASARRPITSSVATQ